MTTFHIISLFPETIKPYLEESIVGLAQKKGLVKIKFYNPRDYAGDKHRTVDDRSYGGGPGMVIKLEPMVKALEVVKKKIGRQKSKIILFSATGKQFNSKRAAALAKNYKHLVLICGRYEGVDARLIKIFKAEEISIGPYVLTGGELAAAVLVDAVSRHLKGVLGRAESLEEKRLGTGVPVYTRPEVFIHKGKKYPAPKVLISGNHKEIERWRRGHRKSL
ncbi:MAG: tRNA (guanosine(37)-N1)-methyltransferase TrmD [Candidatus Colwellbacteria bacterium]|nr:tRNA (guanosine(37)-N1)-methyltransferase TrmD [Candidatus Colwellbacteria bacterium]